MSTRSERILGPEGVLGAPEIALHGCKATRTLEQQYPDAQTTPPLMQRAGLAIAELALALAPHSNTIWVACGPGNNGGDGLIAAQYLQRWGKKVSLTGPVSVAKAAALDGLSWAAEAPIKCELAIDALFGIGAVRGITGVYADWIAQLNQLQVPVLAVDVPSGLHADSGMAAEGPWVMADHTLSLLTLKPGLFTGNGRDACGQIWWNSLGIDTTQSPADALLSGAPVPRIRPHNSHKGSYGDVAIVGGAHGMEGAAILAASAALCGGAGRVFLSLRSKLAAPQAVPPELMVRTLQSLPLDQLTVVAGCGAGEQLAADLPAIITQSQQLVLDADALNTLAQRPDLQSLLSQRPAHRTVLTPHPLEAARLLGTNVQSVQSDRLQAAQVLSGRFNACVVLKGSGSIISAPNHTTRINPTGNARLACAGTGDVLAGLTGALMACGMPGFEAASEAVYRHGRVADTWPAQGGGLTAGQLARAVSA